MARVFWIGLAFGAALLTGGWGKVSAVQHSALDTGVPQISLNTQSDKLMAQATNLGTLEQSIHTQVNQYRRMKGLSPLTLDSRISQQARAHSQAMASGRVPFSHDGFEQRVKVISRTIPYRSAGENVAKNQGYRDPDRQAVQGWIKSAGHRKNMEGAFNLTGVGVARSADGTYYLTQMFIRRQ